MKEMRQALKLLECIHYGEKIDCVKVEAIKSSLKLSGEITNVIPVWEENIKGQNN